MATINFTLYSNADGYERTFRRFDKSGGHYILTFNWWAFIFGIFWYLHKGLWVKALMYFSAVLIFGTLTGGLAIIPILIAAGISGNYDMYLFHRKKTQLWNNASIITVRQARAQKRFEVLEVARQQGILSDTDYTSKRAQLDSTQDRETKLSALEEMWQNDIIDDTEFDERKRFILDNV